MSKSKWLPLLEIVTATLFFSTSGVWTKMAGQDAFVMALFRSLIPVIFLLLLHLSQRKKRALIRKWNRPLMTASVLNAFRSLLFFQALILTDISKAVVMLYTWPVFALVIHIVLKREKISLIKILLLLMAFSGIFIIYMDNILQESLNSQDIAGMSVMIASAFIYSITFVIFKEEGKERNHYEITFYQNFAAVPIFIFAVVLRSILQPEILKTTLSFAGIGLASINGLFVGIFGFLLYFKGLLKLPASVASQLAYLEILFAMMWGILLYHEKPGLPFLIGALLIISAALGRTFLKEKA